MFPDEMLLLLGRLTCRSGPGKKGKRRKGGFHHFLLTNLISQSWAANAQLTMISIAADHLMAKMMFVTLVAFGRVRLCAGININPPPWFSPLLVRPQKLWLMNLSIVENLGRLWAKRVRSHDAGWLIGFAADFGPGQNTAKQTTTMMIKVMMIKNTNVNSTHNHYEQKLTIIVRNPPWLKGGYQRNHGSCSEQFATSFATMMSTHCAHNAPPSCFE